MSFWSRAANWLNNPPEGIAANTNTPAPAPGTVGPPDWNPGDPDGLELQGFDTTSENRSLPFPAASPWSGWASGWATPGFTTQQQGINKLIDIAAACIDLNSNVLSSMPVYRTRKGQVIEPAEWMTNPDDMIYSSWQEFAKQLFWDYQTTGEAFVMSMADYADHYPMRFRVIPPYLVNVEMRGGRRVYNIGQTDLTGKIMHIRYHSTTIDARGHGPLEWAGARMTAIGLLQRYANTIAENGGVPLYWMEIERRINQSEGEDLLERWVDSRAKNAGNPAIVSGGAKLNQAKTMDAKEMALMELSQFNESRIATLLGVPPFLVGLAGASGSLTYSNIADLFDYHDRSSLRPKVRTAMEGLSQWSLPRDQAVELNRDDYTRLPVDKRYAAYAVAIKAGFLLPEEVRVMERLGPLPPGYQPPAISDGSATPATPGAPTTPAVQSRPTSNGKVNTDAAKNLSGAGD